MTNTKLYLPQKSTKLSLNFKRNCWFKKFWKINESVSYTSYFCRSTNFLYFDLLLNSVWNIQITWCCHYVTCRDINRIPISSSSFIIKPNKFQPPKKQAIKTPWIKHTFMRDDFISLRLLFYRFLAWKNLRWKNITSHIQVIQF